MSDLLFIRHAQTDLAGTFCGHTDPQVNDIGRDQIAALLDAMKNETIDAVYTSDLRRAHTTAAALARNHSVPLIASEKLREIHFGDWESLTWAQIEQRDPDYAQRWMDEFPQLAAPNGETVSAFEQRVLEVCADIASENASKRIAVVTHAGVMRVVLQTFCGCTEEQAWARTHSYCCSFTMDSNLASVAAGVSR